MDHSPPSPPATNHQAPEDVPGSLNLSGAVALGTGVMIGAGIFALTGQTARLAGDLFPVAFIVAAIVVGFSAYSYVKLSDAYPSSGGVAMFLREQYGPGTTTGVFAFFMYVSMVINESLVARTFGSYLLQVVDLEPVSFWVPAFGVCQFGPARGVDLGKMPSDDQHEARDFRKLPEPIRLEDTVTTQETREAPDPTMGRDADTEWLLRNGGAG